MVSVRDRDSGTNRKTVCVFLLLINTDILSRQRILFILGSLESA